MLKLADLGLFLADFDILYYIAIQCNVMLCYVIFVYKQVIGVILIITYIYNKKNHANILQIMQIHVHVYARVFITYFIYQIPIISFCQYNCKYKYKQQKSYIQSKNKTMRKNICNNKNLIYIVILVLFLIGLSSSNYILSVNQTNSIVNAKNKLSITMKTSTVIANNSLIVYFDQTYTIDNTTCGINATAINCLLKFNATTLLYSLTLAASFQINTTYVLNVNLTNPYYSNNFQITASNLNTAFLTSATATVNAKTINSTLTGVSNQVGAQTIGIFSLNNDLIPSNSIIYIKSATQTIFNNLFTNSVTCMINNNSLPCTVTSLFGSQILQILSIPANTNIVINVTSINNPPYNNTFIPIQVQIQDSLNRLMQQSTFFQTIPTLLATSNNVILNNWNSTIGALSSCSFYISTFFTTTSNQSVIIQFNNDLIIVPASPAIYTKTTVGNKTRLSISNATLGASSIQFAASIQNPSWVQPLFISAYLLYNSTSFMEKYDIPSNSIVLQTYTSNVTNSLASYLTGVLTTGNFTFDNLNIIANQGIAIKLTLQYGKFNCKSMTVLSSISSLTVQSCNQSILILQSLANLNIMTYWLTYPIVNHFSVQPYSISFVLQTLTSQYSVSSGSASIQLLMNSISATITNLVSEFGKSTNISISESLSNVQLNFSNYLLNSSVQRVVYLYPPNNLIINSNTSIVVLNSSLCQIISIIQLDITLIQLQIAGYLSIKILNIGQRTWNITTYDISNYQSVIGTSLLQTPEYTSTSSSLTFSLSNRTIQQNSTIIITITPRMQYSVVSPLVNIILSDSQVLSLNSCPSASCTLVSSKHLVIQYFSPIMEVTLNVKNSNYPTPINETVFISIYIGSFIYESAITSYQLQPLQFGYIQTFTGLYQQIGVLTINLTYAPQKYTNLTYTGISQIMQSPTSCQPCNSTLINITGKVIYFQKTTITIYGVSTINQTNITLAVSSVEIDYPCSAIQGCRICSNFTNSSTNATGLVCSKCFDASLTNFTLLYQNKCFNFCPISTYSTVVSCVNCEALCYNCSATSCLECNSGYFLLNNNCVDTCPSGYTNNLTSCYLIPIICPLHCTTCLADNQCTKCTSGYSLLSNLCYSRCPSGYKASSNSEQCIIFIPPEEAKYFPFAFFIISILTLIFLSIIKRFQKRSLMMGNFIAFISLLQFGSIIMTLSYTFMSLNQGLFTQALIFVIVLSKISLNLIFLIYFMVRVSKQQEFTNWKQKQQNNSTIYKILIFLSTLISFQVLRIIYSRLLGFEIFFGKFSSGLIFKPINYFSLAYGLTFSVALIILCVNSILDQEGYKTIVFYTCIQTILMQGILLTACLIDSQRSGADQFFDYQVYKVDNQFEQGSFNPIILTSQKQVGGSNQDLFKFYKKLQNSSKKAPHQWRRKTTAVSQQPNYANQSLQQINESPSVQQDKTRMNIFRVKFLKDWKQIQKTLPKTNIYKMRKSHEYISVSPNSRKKIKNDIHKSSSAQKIQVKIPQYTNSSIGQRIKNYFHVIDENSQSRSIIKDAKTERKTDYDDIRTNKLSSNNNNNNNNLVNAYNNNDDEKNNNNKQSQVIFNNRKSPLQNQLQLQLMEQNQLQLQDLSNQYQQQYMQKNKTNLQDMLQRFSDNNISQNVIHNYDQQFSNRKLMLKFNLNSQSPGKIVRQLFDQNAKKQQYSQRLSKQIQFNEKSIQILNNNFTHFTANQKNKEGKSVQKGKDKDTQNKSRKMVKQKQQLTTKDKDKNKVNQHTNKINQKDVYQRTNSFSKRSRSKGQKRRVNKQTQSVYLQRLSNNQAVVQNLKAKSKRYKQLTDF